MKVQFQCYFVGAIQVQFFTFHFDHFCFICSKDEFYNLIIFLVFRSYNLFFYQFIIEVFKILYPHLTFTIVWIYKFILNTQHSIHMFQPAKPNREPAKPCGCGLLLIKNRNCGSGLVFTKTRTMLIPN